MSISFPNDFNIQRSGGLGDLVLHATQWLSQLRADLHQQAESWRTERRLQAELASMSPRERLDIDVTAGNLAWSDECR